MRLPGHAAPGRHSAPGRQELVDLRRRFVHNLLQVPVERLHHGNHALAADRFLPLRHVVPDILVGLPVHQFYMERNLCLNGCAIHFVELVELTAQQ